MAHGPGEPVEGDGGVRTSVVVPYPCYLRVYEPLVAFPRAERSAWERYLRTRSDHEAVDLALQEQRELLTALAAGAWLPPPPRQERRSAFLLRADDELHLCPVQVGLRRWLALHGLLHGDGAADRAVRRVLEQVLPPTAVAAMAVRTASWRAAQPDQVPHILTRRWRVPMAWFVPFDEDERLVEGDRAGRSRLRYRTRMVAARQRMARARAVLQRIFPGGTEPLKLWEIGRWLEEFHPHSWVELDYGGLVELMDEAAIADDRTAADLARALEAARAGDLAAAVSAYGEIESRWQARDAKRRAS